MKKTFILTTFAVAVTTIVAGTIIVLTSTDNRNSFVQPVSAATIGA